MAEAGTPAPRKIGLRAGEVVEVRSADEIMASLGPDGRIDALPFMPEMLQFCGKTFVVSARAHKSCDTIHKTGCRSMEDAVHLEGLRCDGSAHGGCQANCLLYWKEAWLKRRGTPETNRVGAESDDSTRGRSLAVLETATRRSDRPEAFVCQATEMFVATAPLSHKDLRQYFRDLWYGNVKLGRLVWVLALAWLNVIQRWRGGRTFPSVGGNREKTPSDKLDLQAGEMVRVKSREAIVATLDARDRNRGLYFDKEMLPYCGHTVRVAARVERIIDERTGEMLRFGSDCIRLDGVVCKGIYSERRLFCPRAITPYWREVWLERANRENLA